MEVSELMVVVVMPAAKEKLENRTIGVKRSKIRGDTGDILSIISVEDILLKRFCIKICVLLYRL